MAQKDKTFHFLYCV